MEILVEKMRESDDAPEHHCFRHSNFWIALYRFRCFSSAGLNPNNHVVSCRQWCELSELSHRKSARILVDLLVEVLEPELQAGRRGLRALGSTPKIAERDSFVEAIR